MARVEKSPYIDVPPLDPRVRPVCDSLQFNLVGMDAEQVKCTCDPSDLLLGAVLGKCQPIPMLHSIGGRFSSELQAAWNACGSLRLEGQCTQLPQLAIFPCAIRRSAAQHSAVDREVNTTQLAHECPCLIELVREVVCWAHNYENGFRSLI